MQPITAVEARLAVAPLNTSARALLAQQASAVVAAVQGAVIGSVGTVVELAGYSGQDGAQVRCATLCCAMLRWPGVQEGTAGGATRRDVARRAGMLRGLALAMGT